MCHSEACLEWRRRRAQALPSRAFDHTAAPARHLAGVHVAKGASADLTRRAPTLHITDLLERQLVLAQHQWSAAGHCRAVRTRRRASKWLCLLEKQRRQRVAAKHRGHSRHMHGLFLPYPRSSLFFSFFPTPSPTTSGADSTRARDRELVSTSRVGCRTRHPLPR